MSEVRCLKKFCSTLEVKREVYVAVILNAAGTRSGKKLASSDLLEHAACVPPSPTPFLDFSLTIPGSELHVTAATPLSLAST